MSCVRTFGSLAKTICAVTRTLGGSARRKLSTKHNAFVVLFAGIVQNLVYSWLQCVYQKATMRLCFVRRFKRYCEHCPLYFITSMQLWLAATSLFKKTDHRTRSRWLWNGSDKTLVAFRAARADFMQLESELVVGEIPQGLPQFDDSPHACTCAFSVTGRSKRDYVTSNKIRILKR